MNHDIDIRVDLLMEKARAELIAVHAIGGVSSNWLAPSVFWVFTPAEAHSIKAGLTQSFIESMDAAVSYAGRPAGAITVPLTPWGHAGMYAQAIVRADAPDAVDSLRAELKATMSSLKVLPPMLPQDQDSIAVYCVMKLWRTAMQVAANQPSLRPLKILQMLKAVYVPPTAMDRWPSLQPLEAPPLPPSTYAAAHFQWLSLLIPRVVGYRHTQETIADGYSAVLSQLPIAPGRDTLKSYIDSYVELAKVIQTDTTLYAPRITRQVFAIDPNLGSLLEPLLHLSFVEFRRQAETKGVIGMNAFLQNTLQPLLAQSSKAPAMMVKAVFETMGIYDHDLALHAIDAVNRQKCWKCNKEGHIARDCRAAALKCSTCGGTGHAAVACPTDRRAEAAPPNTRCYRCNGVGHMQSDHSPQSRGNTPPASPPGSPRQVGAQAFSAPVSSSRVAPRQSMAPPTTSAVNLGPATSTGGQKE